MDLDGNYAVVCILHITNFNRVRVLVLWDSIWVQELSFILMYLLLESWGAPELKIERSFAWSSIFLFVDSSHFYFVH